MSAAVLFFWIRLTVLWPYTAGAVVLVVGLAAVSRKQVREEPGLERFVPLGPVLFAIPMAIFSGDHFVAARAVGGIVPSWMPWHLFWAYFVGTALMAAALSIAARKESQLAAALLGIMLFLFVLMIHIPACFATPFDASRLTIALRDSALSAGAFSFAAVQAEEWQRGAYRGWGFALGSAAWKRIPAIARVVIGVALTYFGIQHLRFPSFAPGFPQEGPGVVVAMPSWIPAHVFWGYLTGAIMIGCAIALLMNWRPRAAANVLAAMVLVLVVFVYVPLTIKNASNIALGLNYLAIHFALAGDALLLASALPKGIAEEVAVPAARKASLEQIPPA
ncbi:MAG TPA: hypothetical protein VKS44_11670 [Candidatus Acidoferrales bacterium]|nr:hypothetical protein [Candidatus Acidoferrales bacterium]